MKHYLDTSVVLAWLLEGHDGLGELEGEVSVGSSRLLWVEVSRVLHRAIHTGRLNAVVATEVRHNFARFAAGLDRIRLSEAVLHRAGGPFPLVIRTLDAMHLASAEVWLGERYPDANVSELIDERSYHAQQWFTSRAPAMLQWFSV